MTPYNTTNWTYVLWLNTHWKMILPRSALHIERLITWMKVVVLITEYSSVIWSSKWLSQHHYRYAQWCCDVSEDLGRGICAYRPSANKLFLIIPNGLCWHTWVCICSNCVICHYYSCVNLGNHLYNAACWT